jgi:hypothetical protein
MFYISLEKYLRKKIPINFRVYKLCIRLFDSYTVCGAYFKFYGTTPSMQGISAYFQFKNDEFCTR